MKILESQNAVLSNYEVYQHLVDSQQRFSARHKKEHRRPPPNYRTVTKEVLQYCRRHPSPLSQEPLTYSGEAIATLVQQLSEFSLTKGEVLMIVNLRPADGPSLHICIDMCAERFTAEQQARIRAIIIEVLGTFPPVEAEETAEKAAAGEADAPLESIENGGAI